MFSTPIFLPFLITQCVTKMRYFYSNEFRIAQKHVVIEQIYVVTNHFLGFNLLTITTGKNYQEI